MSLYRKYRPQKFTDVIGQEHVTTTVTNQIASEEISHAYLFTGPRGVGKTTMARLIAKSLNCQKPQKQEPCSSCQACEEIVSGSSLDVIEIDAASHTDVDNVRENIIKNVRFAPSKLKYKVFIIDEVHMLSTSAFNALLKTLEEPPAHAIFILATTEIHKVPQTIISRCQRFDYKKVQPAVLIKRLQFIAKAEGIEIEDAVLEEVARHSEGCVRDAESLLEQIFSLGEKKITLETASLVLPATNALLVNAFIEAIISLDAAKSIELINGYVEQGIDVVHFLDDTISILRDKMFEELKSSQQKAESSKEIEFICQAIEAFLEARRHVRTDKIPQLPIELAVVELCGGNQGQGSGVRSQERDFNTQEVGSSRVKDVGAAPGGHPLEGNEQTNKSETLNSKSEENPKPEIRKEQNETPTTPPTPPKPPTPPPKALGTVPVLSLDEVKKKWPEVFAQIRECNASLPLVVQAGELSKVEGDEVEMKFNYQLHADTINQDKNSRLLSQILERVTGQALRIKGKYQRVEKEEAVADLLEEFGGKVV
ncbi:DNA polymerase III subunit gamma/tau [Patescibacteria group bacterium]